MEAKFIKLTACSFLIDKFCFHLLILVLSIVNFSLLSFLCCTCIAFGVVNISSSFCVSDLLFLISLFCLPAVARICYAHLAAAQVGQFIKFDEMSETSSSHGDHTLAGSVPVQELSRLHEKVSSLMFFY